MRQGEVICTRTETLRDRQLIARFRVSLVAADAAASGCCRLLVRQLRSLLIVRLWLVIEEPYLTRLPQPSRSPRPFVHSHPPPLGSIRIGSFLRLLTLPSLLLHLRTHIRTSADACASSLQNGAMSREGQEAAGEREEDVLVHFSLRSLFFCRTLSFGHVCLPAHICPITRASSLFPQTHRCECAVALSALSRAHADTHSRALSDCFAVVFFACRRCVLLLCVYVCRAWVGGFVSCPSPRLSLALFP